MNIKELLEALAKAGYDVDTNADEEVKTTFGSIEKSASGESEDEYRAVVSTSSVDRDNEIVDVRGMDVEWYQKNPVICWSHQWAAPPVGSAARVKAGKEDISIGFVFANTTFAQELRQLVDEGHLRTMSVGMIGVKSIWNGEDGWDEYVKANKRRFKEVDWAGVRRVLIKSVMVENSLCTIPANPDAMLIERVKSLSAETQKQLGIEQKEEPETPPVTVPTPRLIARLVRAAQNEDRDIIRDALDIYRGRI